MSLPADYVPLNGCVSCGRDFASLDAFDRHRTGEYAHDLSLDHPEGRRCLDDDELAAVGLYRVDAGDSTRHEQRIASSGVPLYLDPAKAEGAGVRLRARAGPVEGRGAAPGTTEHEAGATA